MDRAFAIAPTASLALIATQTEQAIQRPLSWLHQSGALLIGTALHLALRPLTMETLKQLNKSAGTFTSVVVDGILHDALIALAYSHGYSYNYLESDVVTVH